LKKSVLRADMPRNTKVLEIHATLSDPKAAHALALYIAEETVKLNETISREGDRELSAEAEKQATEDDFLVVRASRFESPTARSRTDLPGRLSGTILTVFGGE